MNQINLEAAKSLINEKYIHNENWTKPWNYDIKPGRDIYYPNDKLLQLNQ